MPYRKGTVSACCVAFLKRYSERSQRKHSNFCFVLFSLRSNSGFLRKWVSRKVRVEKRREDYVKGWWILWSFEIVEVMRWGYKGEGLNVTEEDEGVKDLKISAASRHGFSGFIDFRIRRWWVGPMLQRIYLTWKFPRMDCIINGNVHYILGRLLQWKEG